MSFIPPIVVALEDRARLLQLASVTDEQQVAEQLEIELERAEVVPLCEVPDDVIVMNSDVEYEDVQSRDRRRLRLVYPNDADSRAARVSILAPLGCALLALSVDSLFSHFAWIRSIHAQFGVKVPFPIIEDPSMAIARAYGMIAPQAPDAAMVRAVFVIDPEGIIRAITWYPMTTGRNVEELLRLLAALQVSDAHDVSTPEGWRPGDAVILPPELTPEAVFAPQAPVCLGQKNAQHQHRHRFQVLFPVFFLDHLKQRPMRIHKCHRIHFRFHLYLIIIKQGLELGSGFFHASVIHGRLGPLRQ